MRTIIAGSRSINDFQAVVEAVKESGFDITEAVSGGARGVDLLGERWAIQLDIPIKQFLPDFDKMDHRSFWKAPLARNTQMAEYAEALILVWDGVSRGSLDMHKKAAARGLKIYVKQLKPTAG